MAEFLRDSFSGADGLSLTAYNPGWSMVGTSGIARVQDGRAYQSGSTAAIYARTDVLAPSADYSVSADFISTATAGSPSMAVGGRMSATVQNGYQVRHQRGNRHFHCKDTQWDCVSLRYRCLYVERGKHYNAPSGNGRPNTSGLSQWQF